MLILSQSKRVSELEDKMAEKYNVKVGDTVVFTGELTDAYDERLPSMRMFRTINITVVD